MNEKWKKIEGYNNKYEVSSSGNIKSYKNKTPILLKPRKNNRGYLYVNLCFDGKCKSVCVHRLVAVCFLDKSNLTVNHKDGNKENNSVENLEWLTITDNIKHAKENKLLATGERNGRHKLKVDDVILIRKKYNSGTNNIRGLAREFNVSRAVIIKIVKNINWKNYV